MNRSEGPQAGWWRPLSTRQGQGAEGGLIRLIGLELRIRNPYGRVEEIEMVPLKVEIPGVENMAMRWQFGPLTLHTSVGDVGIIPVDIPTSAY